jgi:Fe-Mn family superoxide dismutase
MNDQKHQPMTRRHAIKATVVGAAACATALSDWSIRPVVAQTAAAFEVPPLPYAFDALEPHIDARTMEIHHDKHHAGYVAKLNAAVAEIPALGRKSIETLIRDLNTLPETVRASVRNNGGGHYNHALFWQMLKKGGGGQPTGDLATALDKAFGGFSQFQAAFTQAALGQFGSGWAWLTVHEGRLQVETTPNQDSPLTAGRSPLLGLDVWEHAYYLKYQNRRADYVAAWWNVVNWECVAERYAHAQG